MNKVTSYIESLKKDLDCIKITDIEDIVKIMMDSRLIFICGNGGSASTASHLTNDFEKSCNLNIMCLSDNVPLITAWANDERYDLIFSKRIEQMGGDKDSLIILTSSGDSKNLIKAIEAALLKNMKVIALLGKDGGTILKKYHDKIKIIHINTDPQRSEDLQLIIGHIIYKIIGIL